jgi:hypothetical protein
MTSRFEPDTGGAARDEGALVVQSINKSLLLVPRFCFDEFSFEYGPSWDERHPTIGGFCYNASVPRAE